MDIKNIYRDKTIDKMTEAAFSQMYERVKDVLYSLFLTSVNREEFENQLKWY